MAKRVKYLIFMGFILVGLCAHAQEKGAMTNEMEAARIVDGAEVVASDLPFTKGLNKPFTLFLMPKSQGNTTEVVLMKAKYFQGDTVTEIPMSINQWNVPMLVTLEADNAALFAEYRVFVGFGKNQNK
jgi:hypothetical protein